MRVAICIILTFCALMYAVSLPELRSKTQCEKQGNVWSYHDHVCLMVMR